MPEEFRTLRTQKKRGTFSPSSVVLRSSTTYNSQLQRVKPTPYGGSVAASLWELFLKLSKFQNNQISYFAFSYSMVCITELCGSDHRRFVSLLFIVLSKISGANIQLFLLPSASLQKLRRSHHGDVQVGKSFLVAGQYHVGMIR